MIKNSQIQKLSEKYYENKLSHVFLIETNNQEALINDLLELIKVINCPEDLFLEDCNKCNLCHLISTRNLPSLKIIYPDGQAIKEYQMEELKKYFSSVPYISKFSCYIINNTEKFNTFSANTMLKFIEEPEDNIIGFLITNNKENVINTIKSRCEIVRAFYQNENEPIIDSRIKGLAYQYLYKVEIEKKESIVYNMFILDEKLERDEIVSFFKVILNLYMTVLQNEQVPELLIGLQKFNHQEIIKRIYLVNEIIERMNYNSNVNLVLDYFVLGLED